MLQEVLDLGKSEFRSAAGFDEMPRDKDGFLRLTYTASRADKKAAELTTSISSLEDKLKRYKEEKAKIERYQKTDEYKESKKKESKKKQKKRRETLLEMVFNNADHDNEEVDPDDEEEAGYHEKKSRKKKESNTLDTTYGKRFSPVVSMLYDTINEFDRIAIDIQTELDSPQLRMKNMYRSTQIGNLISAKNSKLSAVRELASVATTISNLEYKKEKDKKAEEGSDSSKAISSLGAKFLRGSLDGFGVSDKDKKSKKEKEKQRKKSLMSKHDDDDDDETGTISKRKSSSDDDDRELASEFAKALLDHKEDISFTPAEKYMNMDGKYSVVVVCDSTDPENTWRYEAVDKHGKLIKGFKDDYKGLLPKKKNARMVFDIGKRRCTDRASARTYKLLFID